MKTRLLSFPLASALAALLSAPSASALTYFWDNVVGAGFGAAGGTWDAPTPGPTPGWTTDGTGAAVPGSITTATTDTVNFGNGATGLAGGTITVSGTVSTGNMTFASGSGTITLSGGGVINLGGSRTITTNYTAGVNVTRAITSEIALSGASIFSFGDTGTGGGDRQLTLGVLSGTGGTTFQYTGGNNGRGIVLLNGASTYSGNTLISTSLINARTEVRLGVVNALPTTTILTIGGAAGTGSGRTTALNMNGKNQTLAGLATSGGGADRTLDVFSSTAAVLTVNDAGNRAFAGRIGGGGNNISVVKQGAGNWTLSGGNLYVGQTSVEGGTITVSNATALGTTAGNTVVSSGGRVFVGTASLSVAEAFNIAGAGVAGANGAINIGGGATVIGVVFSGAITLSGNATIQGDGSTSSTFSGGINLGANTLTFKESGTITVGTVGISGAGGSVVKNTGGTTTFNTANTYDGLTTVNAGGLRISDNSGLGTTAGSTVVNGSATGGPNVARLELTGGITVTGEALTINGAGTNLGALTSVSGVNEWAGNVTLGLAGTRLGASAGATLKVSGVIDSGVVNTGLIVRAADATSLVVLSGVNTYLGNTNLIIGKLQLDGGNDRLPAGTKFSMGNAANVVEFDLNGRDQEIAGLTLNAGVTAANNSVNNSSVTASTLTVNTAAASPSTFAGKLNGNLALTKTGADTLTLGGANTYTGDTIVTAGTLVLASTGSINSTSGVTIGTTSTAATTEFNYSSGTALSQPVAFASGSTGGTLSGTGTITQAVTIPTGNTLSPGNSIGSLGFGDALILGTGSTASFEVDADTIANRDRVTGISALTYGGKLKITATGTLSSGDSWDLFDFTSQSGTFDNTASFGTDGSSDADLPDLGPGLTWQFDYTTGILSLSSAGGYASWIDGFFPGENNPLIIDTTADPDFDGIANSVEMVIGGNPTTGMDTALLPTLELVTDPGSIPAIPAGDYLLFTYRRTAVSEAALATAACETDTDLVAPWTAAVNGGSGVVIQEDLDFTFTPAAPADTDRVRVYVPRGANTTLFGRLNVTIP